MTTLLTPRNGVIAKHLSLAELHDITSNQRYGVEYQPLVSTANNEIIAYEALARFYRADGSPVSPSVFFDALHSSPRLFHRVEAQLKQLQLSESPAHYDLFLNVDPHAVMAGDKGSNDMLRAIAEQSHVVIELIENADIHHAHASESLQQQLNKLGVRTALDDIGAPHSLLSLELLTRVDYLKFDRSWLTQLQNPQHIRLFRSLLAFARQSGKTTVLEGIETEAMLAQAIALGVDYVQGFIYRPDFIPDGNVTRP